MTKKTIITIFLSVCFGILLGVSGSETPVPETKIETKTETVEVVKTPQECRELIELDNSILNQTASFFESMSNRALASGQSGDVMGFLEGLSADTLSLSSYVEDTTPERNRLIEACLQE